MRMCKIVQITIVFCFELLILSSAKNFYNELKIISAASRFTKIDIPLPSLSESIAYSTEIALESCQQLFKWDRWYCPKIDFLSKLSSQTLDRETAFVQAISTAALIYTITKNCSRGEVVGCGCEIRKNVAEGQNDIWSGCSEKVDYGEYVTDLLFSDKKRNVLDSQWHTDMHNVRAVQTTIRNSMRKHCRCHGLSGSCSLQTCWTALDAFPKIATDLRKMYDHAEKITLDNNGNIFKALRDDVLVFMFDSPNYCHKNVVPGWMGTKGRECSRNKTKGISNQERKSCKNLCRSCGLNVRKRKTITSTRCNCKFNWCCDVTCDVCKEQTITYFCN